MIRVDFEFLVNKIDREVIVCPDCKGRLFVKKEPLALFCSVCNSKYPIINGIPVLFPSKKLFFKGDEISQQINYKFASEDLLIAFGVSSGFQFKDNSLSHEFGNISGRFSLDNKQDILENIIPVNIDNTIANHSGLEFVRSYGGIQLKRKSIVYRSFRVCNRISETIGTVGVNPYHISYHVFDSLGNCIIFEGLRSRIPIPMINGKELTIPIKIEVPDVLDDCFFTFHLVHEGIEWFPEFSQAKYTIINDSLNIPNLKEGQDGDFNYVEDLKICSDMINSIGLSTHTGNDDNAALFVEIASGFHPQLLLNRNHNSDVICIDLCLPELQLANIYYRDNLPDSKFIMLSGDCMDLPLGHNSVNLFVICAALHHFSNPVELLKSLKLYLKPSGKILLLREPSFVNPEDSNFIRELSLGFNEQQFHIDEWISIFEVADFQIDEIRIDFGGSLKAILSYAINCKD